VTARAAPCAVEDGLAVYRFGAGEPVLLMPGPHRLQRPGLRAADALIAGLVALGRQVITYDPPGSGRSTRPARLSMAEMHECADEALRAYAASGPVDAVGHSMGGLAVLAYAIDRPRQVGRLVLIGTGSGGPAYMNAPGALWDRSHPGFRHMALLGVLHIAWPRLATERLLNDFIHRQSFHDPRLADRQRVSPGDWFRPRQARTDWHRVARRLDYSPRLAEVTAPALVLCGRHDPQYPAACSEELAAGIPDARVVLFERSGHYPFLEEPGAFWAAVGRFLAAPAPRRAGT